VPDLASLSAVAAYAVLAGLVFAESGILLGFFLPGDTVLLAAGLLSGGSHPRLSLPVLIVVVLVAAVLGDAAGYWFGARAGVGARPGRRVLNPDNLRRAQRFYDRWGGWAVVAARWVPWVRVFTPVLAGAAGMRYPVFLAANVLGAVLWGVGLLTAGHVAAGAGPPQQVALGVAAAAVATSVLLVALRVRRASGRRG
jgi:membrane-associated protein